MNTSQYAFADRAQEQRRLATQAELLDPLTERVFRDAGLGTELRVLDLGSGAGDVAILAVRLVGREEDVCAAAPIRRINPHTRSINTK